MDIESFELRDLGEKGQGVFATRAFRAGETVMVGGIGKVLPGNTAHASQVAENTFILPEGLMSLVNHSCDPACGIRVNGSGAHDYMAVRPIEAGDEVTFDYAMQNYVIEHFPPVCTCGAATCRGRVTGWRDLSDEQKRAYEGIAAPYLAELDRRAASVDG